MPNIIGPEPQLHRAYIALGSNLPSIAGDSKATIRGAIERLASLARIDAVSSMYETDPVGYAEQPRFINAAAVLTTNLSPDALLKEMLVIEREFGRDRDRGIPKGPRTLDLDLLLYDDLILDSADLTLPHPSLHERRFVLAPLAEIASDVIHPQLMKSMARLFAELPRERG